MFYKFFSSLKYMMTRAQKAVFNALQIGQKTAKNGPWSSPRKFFWQIFFLNFSKIILGKVKKFGNFSTETSVMVAVYLKGMQIPPPPSTNRVKTYDNHARKYGVDLVIRKHKYIFISSTKQCMECCCG